MPDDMGKSTPRKEVRDAVGEMARTVRDAAEASRQTSRGGGEAIRRAAERTSGTASRVAGDAADAGQKVAKRSAEQFDQIFTRQFETSQEVARHAQQNLDVLMQVGGGWPAASSRSCRSGPTTLKAPCGAMSTASPA